MGSPALAVRSLSKPMLTGRVLRGKVGRYLGGSFISCPEHYLFFSGGAGWSRYAGFLLGPIVLPKATWGEAMLPRFTLPSSFYLSSLHWLALRPAPPQLLAFLSTQ